MKTYLFRVELEPQDDGFRAFYPPWEHIGASIWGSTREEAQQKIQAVLENILDRFADEGKTPPGLDKVETTGGLMVAIPL